MKRLSLGFLALSSPLLVLALLLPVSWAGWCFAVLSMAYPVALIAVGGAVRGRTGRLAGGLVLLAVLLEAGVVGLFVWSGSDVRVAGLPLSTLWALLLLGAVPWIVTAVVYLADFDRFAGRAGGAGGRSRR